MTFKINSVNITLLFITSMLVIFLGTGGSIYLSTHDILSKNNPLLLFLLIAGLTGGILNIYFVNHGLLLCILSNDGFKGGKREIKWQEIKSYKIEDVGTEFRRLKIKTQKGKTIRIAHRKKFSQKDDFDRLVFAFENKVFQQNQRGLHIIKAPPIWETALGKIYGYLIVLIISTYGVVAFVKGLSSAQFTMYIIFIAGAIPLLIKIFKKKK